MTNGTIVYGTREEWNYRSSSPQIPVLEKLHINLNIHEDNSRGELPRQKWKGTRRSLPSWSTSPVLPLSETEINLLSKGLSFSSSLLHTKKEEILDDLENYFRRLHLKEFFLEEAKEEQNDAQTQFRLPSTWMPPTERDPVLKTYK